MFRKTFRSFIMKNSKKLKMNYALSNLLKVHTCNIFYFSFSCSDLDETKVNKVDNDPVPHAMINLETWLPANYQVDGWQVRDLGALGAGGR